MELLIQRVSRKLNYEQVEEVSLPHGDDAGDGVVVGLTRGCGTGTRQVATRALQLHLGMMVRASVRVGDEG